MGNTQQEQAITDDEDLSLENLVVLTFFFFFKIIFLDIFKIYT
jgi:hypothetical protein